MRKILIATGWLDVSGIETFIMNIIRNIDRNLFQIDFLLNQEKDSRYSREARVLGSKFYYIPQRKDGLLNYLRSCSKFFKEDGKKYDVLHYCGGSLTSVAVLYYAKKVGIPNIIAHAHSTSTEGIHNKILHQLNKTFRQNLFNHNLACSKEAGHFFFGNRDFMILNNGIDIDSFKFQKPIRNKFRLNLGIDSDDLVLGHVGRFVPLKNHKFLIEIFKEFLKIHHNSKLLLVGTGPEEKKIKQIVKENKISDKVIFLGERADIPELLWTMDYFLMPSIYEGLPFVLIEAQSAGLRCLVSENVSKDSKLSDNVVFLPINDNPKEWVECVINWESKSNNRDSWKDVEERGYNIKEIVKIVENIYNGK